MPDPLGDLLFNGIAQDAFKQNVAYAAQSDGAYKLDDSHTLRGGLFLQTDHSISDTDIAGAADRRGRACRSSDVPTVDRRQRRRDRVDLQRATCRTSGRLRRLSPSITACASTTSPPIRAADQVSPRLNIVWQALPDTTCMPAIPAIFRRRRSSWWAPRTSRCSQNTTVAAARRRGRRAAGRDARITTTSGVQQKHHARLHRGPRHLLQAVGEPDRRGPVRRAHHPHAVQLPLRQAVRRRADRSTTRRQNSPPTSISRAERRRARTSTRRSSISRQSRSRLHRAQLHPSGSRAAAHRLGRRLLSVARHALQRGFPARARACGRICRCRRARRRRTAARHSERRRICRTTRRSTSA